MKRWVAIVWSGTLVVAYMAGSALGAGGIGGAGPGWRTTTARLPPRSCRRGTIPRSRLHPIQGEPTHYSGETLRKAHLALQARAQKAGRQASRRATFMTPLVTRNYSYIMVHRAPNAAQPTPKPAAELHEGVTDVYYVVGGTGTVYVGGEMRNRRTSRPGEVLRSDGGRQAVQAAGRRHPDGSAEHGPWHGSRPGRDDLRAPEDQRRPVSVVAHQRDAVARSPLNVVTACRRNRAWRETCPGPDCRESRSRGHVRSRRPPPSSLHARAGPRGRIRPRLP